VQEARASGGKKGYPFVRATEGDEIGEGSADDGSEFETVAAESAGEGYMGMSGMPVDDEVFIGSHGIEADGMSTNLRSDTGQIMGEELLDTREIVGQQ